MMGVLSRLFTFGRGDSRQMDYEEAKALAAEKSTSFTFLGCGSCAILFFSCCASARCGGVGLVRVACLMCAAAA